MTRRNLINFWNGDHGPVMQWRCSCGHEGFMDQHGDTAECRDCDESDVARTVRSTTTNSTTA